MIPGPNAFVLSAALFFSLVTLAPGVSNRWRPSTALAAQVSLCLGLWL